MQIFGLPLQTCTSESLGQGTWEEEMDSAFLITAVLFFFYSNSALIQHSLPPSLKADSELSGYL